MGPSRAREQDDVKALLREKDDRIAALEMRLEAYSARTSTAHTRLLKTIDALDALRSQHALEISAEEQAKMKLVREVDCWRSMARNLEVEKDELKDVVEDLIEKVQVSNEWSSWPSSRMHITKYTGNLNLEFPEQVAAGPIDGGGTKNDHDGDMLAYASSIIARLRTELDLERQSHRRTVEEANLRIEELEAKVAMREAELESYITSHGDREPGSASPYVPEKRKVGERLPKPKPLSDEECLHFLESNHARNRSLELEIRHIAERLEQARIAALAASGSCKDPRSPTPESRATSTSVDPNALPRPPEAEDTTSTPPPPPLPSTTLSIAQLDNQIRTMATQIDALVSERTALVEVAARQRRITDGINTDAFQDVLRVEGECVRLQAEVDDLREQLQHARTFARGREKTLLREIAQFRASASGSSDSRPAPGLLCVFSPQTLEDDIESEREESMELASPLTPTIVPDLDRLSQDSETELQVCRSPGPGPREMESVQAALDAARIHLAQKEEALAQLRVEMERLQLEVRAAQMRNDGEGDAG